MPRPVLPPAGVILYDGPSMLDGAPVVVVLTSIRGTSANTKTSAGALPLAQTYIIPRAMLQGMAAGDKRNNFGAWFQNLAAGRDASACGACELRPSAVAAARAAGTAPDACYVLNGPPDVAAAIVAGAYPTATLADAADYVRAMVRRGRIAGVRGGSWGDPAAAPLAVHAALRDALTDPDTGSPYRVRHPDGVERRAVWTCYTRTWEYNTAAAAGWRRLAMASAHNPGEARRALAEGWRPFVVVDGRRPEAVAEAVALVTDEPGMHCPASTERDTDATCSTCGACDGARTSSDYYDRGPRADPRGAVVILSHGPSNRGARACAANVAILARLDEARRARAEAKRGGKSEGRALFA